MSSLDIAPHPESAPTRVRDRRRMRHRLRVSFRRAGNCTIWRLGFRQFSFHHIARVPRRTVPDTWTRPPVSCHALVPLTFRRQVRHRTQGHPSNPSRLRRGYNEAPRGAPLFCRIAVVACARTYAQLCITFHDSAGALTSQRQLLHKVFTWPHRARSMPTLRGLSLRRPRGWVHADHPVPGVRGGLSWCHVGAWIGRARSVCSGAPAGWAAC
jgi:hypothetical protein